MGVRASLYVYTVCVGLPRNGENSWRGVSDKLCSLYLILLPVKATCAHSDEERRR